MTTYEIVRGKLITHPEFRERSKRGVYLTKLALRYTDLEVKFENGEKQLTLQELSDFATKYDTFRHAWGDVTREYPELRGTDYDKGEILAQEKKIELGYVPFTCDQKELENYVENNNK
jgi:hypothetical protein